MNYILVDDQRIHNLLPFTHTRPVSELRCGILTMKEKWEKQLNTSFSYHSSPHLKEKFPLKVDTNVLQVLVNAGVFPDANLIGFLKLIIAEGQEVRVEANGVWIMDIRSSFGSNENIDENIPSKTIPYPHAIHELKNTWDIFSLNDWAIRQDYELLTKGRISQPIPANTTVIGQDIFIEEGAVISCSIINTESGPVYIGKDGLVMEGCLIRGPLALGEGSVLKMGAKIYGATTLGPGCKVGGEVHNTVFIANANKAHDGYLGNAVIGEWCNLGADSNNSNLKNNYEEVKLWNEHKKTFTKTGLQFCGLMMGDHSKCGINTMFNTGTVVGVSCNIYGAGFPRNFIPSFSWGSANGFIEYQLKKAIETAQRVFERRKMDFNDVEQRLLQHVYEATKDQRNY